MEPSGEPEQQFDEAELSPTLNQYSTVSDVKAGTEVWNGDNLNENTKEAVLIQKWPIGIGIHIDCPSCQMMTRHLK